MIAAIFLFTLGIYLTTGFLFSLAFVIFGVGKIDSHAVHGSWGFRVLIVPGAAALWPILVRRWIRGEQEPPEQCDAHRKAAKPNL
jgi:hypothetical protein